MTLTDVIILIIVLILLGFIIFFSFIFPRIKGENAHCASCPVVKKAKRTKKKMLNMHNSKKN